MWSNEKRDKCEACGKVRWLTRIDSGQLLCNGCLREIRPPRPKELAAEREITFLRNNGLAVPDDLTQVEAKRLSTFLVERRHWPDLPECTPLELMEDLGAARYDELGSGSRQWLAEVRTKILKHAMEIGAEAKIPGTIKIRHFFTKVVGVSRQNDDGSDRQKIMAGCSPFDSLIAEHEDNPHDPNAIRVCTLAGDQIGYLPKVLATELSWKMRQGFNFAVIAAQITGKTGRQSNLGMNVLLVVANPGISQEQLQQYLDDVTPEVLERCRGKRSDEEMASWDMSRPIGDVAALRMRDANRCFVNETRLLESTDPEEAIKRYRQAITNLRNYQSRLHGWNVSPPPDSKKSGELGILDRLTRVLVRLGKIDEAAVEAEAYMKEFPADRLKSMARGIARRIISPRTARGIKLAPTGLKPEQRFPTLLPDGWEFVTERGQTGVRLSRKFRREARQRYPDCFGKISEGTTEAKAEALEECCVAIEIRAEKQGGLSLPPHYHRRLAVMYRKLRRYIEECLILERFLSFPIRSPLTVSEFKVRLARARQLAGLSAGKHEKD